MSGSLQIKKNNYYCVLSIKDENGKNKTKWITLKIPAVKGNKRKAEAEMKRVVAEYEAQEGLKSNGMLFSDYLSGWLEEHRRNLTQGSYESYKINLDRHLCPYYSKLGVKLSELEPIHIQDYYAQKLGEDKPLTANTLKKHHSLVRKCLQHALQMNQILYNPADRVTLPRIERYQGKAYTVEQATELFALCKGDILETPIFLALHFGLRRSEALGLRWVDVDFGKEVLHIRHTVVRLRTIVEKESTKNRSSARSLPMLGSAKEYLQAVKTRQEEEKRLFGKAYADSGYVCRWPDGKMLDPSLVSAKFTAFVKRSGLPVIRLHDLRHSAASILVSMGCNVKQVSSFLGHNQTSTTLDIYAHLFNSASVDLMCRYDSILSGAKT